MHTSSILCKIIGQQANGTEENNMKMEKEIKIMGIHMDCMAMHLEIRRTMNSESVKENW